MQIRNDERSGMADSLPSSHQLFNFISCSFAVAAPFFDRINRTTTTINQMTESNVKLRK